MKTRRTHSLVSALLLGLSVAAFAGDAPAAAPDKPAIPKSDRWFSVRTAEEGKAQAYLHISIKPSDDESAPVRVFSEMRFIATNRPDSLEIDSNCLNDNWLSPVQITMTAGAGTDEAEIRRMTITRPDPKSTAGKMTQVWNADKLNGRKWDIKERTCLYFAPLDFVCRLPFEKDKNFDFAIFDADFWDTRECRLSYMGEEDVKLNGQSRNLYKFKLRAGDKASFAEFWLTDKHELVQAQFAGALLIPGAETEARGPIAECEAKLAGAENTIRMSEGVAGCAAIHRAMRVYFAQNNVYPTLDDVAGDQLEAALHIAPKDLDGKFFRAAGYVVNSTAKGYTIKAILGAQTYVIDEKGVESGTYRTK